MTLFWNTARANSVPAAAVTQDVQALLFLIRCKAYAGCCMDVNNKIFEVKLNMFN